MAQRSDRLSLMGDTAGMSKAQIQANEYLRSKKVFDLFNFLIGHLLVEEPEDPVEFLVNLLDKCMLFRAGLCEAPLLFNSQHVESMFRALDPSGTGFITMGSVQNRNDDPGNFEFRRISPNRPGWKC